MRCAIYSRKSKATEKGESIEAQISTCKEYMGVAYHLQPGEIDVYIDEGFSGKNTKRPRFVEMIQQVRQKKYNYVVSYKLDRISRNVCDFADVYSIMQKSGCEYISVDEKFDTSTPVGRAMMYIASVFAQMERETIAQRVTDNMLFLSRTGRWLGGRNPIGYKARRIGVNPAMGINKEYSVLEEDPDTIGNVRLVFEKYLELGSIHAVQRWLSENRIVLSGGAQPSDFSVKNILTNPVYCAADKDAYRFFHSQEVTIGGEISQFNGSVGLLGYNRHQFKEDGLYKRPIQEWVVAPSFHPPLISGQQWVEVQKRLGTASAANPREQGAKNDYALLSGLLYCAKCGAKMHVQPQNSSKNRPSNGRFTYICQTRKNFGISACDCKSLSGTQLDDLLRSEIAKASDATSSLGQKIASLKVKEDSRKRHITRLASLNLEFEAKKKKMSALVDRMTQEGTDEFMIAMIKQQGKELGDEMRQLQTEIDAEATKEENVSSELDVVEAVVGAINDFNQAGDSLSIPMQRDILRTAIDRVEWDGESISVFLSGE